MAKESMKAKEKKRLRLYEKYKNKRDLLKQKGNYQALDKLPKNSSIVRLHNRCRITGRPKGYIRKFGICRIVFRDLASEGKIPGVTKASW